MMSYDEKILLLKLILEDIRGNWGWENGNRKDKAYDLSKELYIESNEEEWNILCECIEEYEHGDDGRYFRCNFPRGYVGMKQLYNITDTYNDKSKDFKNDAKYYLTYPEYCFDDWEEKID